jgi:hypothetical protein
VLLPTYTTSPSASTTGDLLPSEAPAGASATTGPRTTRSTPLRPSAPVTCTGSATPATSSGTSALTAPLTVSAATLPAGTLAVTR